MGEERRKKVGVRSSQVRAASSSRGGERSRQHRDQPLEVLLLSLAERAEMGTGGGPVPPRRFNLSLRRSPESAGVCS